MKKFLFGLLTFLGIGLSFCSAGNIAEFYPVSLSQGDKGCYYSSDLLGDYDGIEFSVSELGYFSVYYGFYNEIYGENIQVDSTEFPVWGYYFNSDTFVCVAYYDYSYTGVYNAFFNSQGGSSSSDIDVYYNNGNSVENITCDGTQAISINGLSTITSTNTFTPYFNIDYIDENNQLLTESYSKDILYLAGSTFKKTYTGNNNRILTAQGTPETIFTGYLPTFDITGGIDEVSESGNIFNNFAENSIKMTLSNIPSYIQYVIILVLLFFILGFIRKFRRK